MGKNTGFAALAAAAKDAEIGGELKSAVILAVREDGEIYHLRDVKTRGFTAARIENKEELFAWLLPHVGWHG